MYRLEPIIYVEAVEKWREHVASAVVESKETQEERQQQGAVLGKRLPSGYIKV